MTTPDIDADGRWELSGRGPQLALVDRLLREGRRGVLLTGVPGIGKTRLAAEALRRSRAAGTHTEWVAATRSASWLPFGSLLALLPPVEVMTLSAARAAAGPVELIVAAIKGRAGDRTTVLAIDDAHLLDDAAAALVHYLVTTGQVRLLMTARAGVTMPEALAGLWRDGRVERIDLPPLTEDEVGELVSAALGGPVAAESRARLHHISEGNPLMLREVVSQSRHDGAFSHSGVLWHWSGLVASGPRLDDLVGEHLLRISDEDREILRLVSFGQSLRAEVLYRLAAQDVVATLVAGGLIVCDIGEHGELFRISHPLYAEYLRDRTTSFESRSIMQKLAGAMTEAGDLSQEEEFRLARWWVDSGHPGDHRVLAKAAARAFVIGQVESAADFARAALAHGPEFDAALTLAEACQSLPAAESWPLFEAARHLATDDRDQTRWAIAVLQSMRRSQVQPERLLEAAEAILMALTDHGLQDLIRGQMAVNLAALGRTEESRALTSPLLDSPEISVRVRALLVSGATTILGGGAADIETLAKSLLEPSRLVEDQLRGSHNLVRTAHLGAMLALGRFAEIGEFVAAFDPVDVDNEAADFSCFVDVLSGVLPLMAGTGATAIRELRETYDKCRASRGMYLGWSAALLIQALAMVGDADGAEQIALQIQDLPPIEPYDADRARATAWTAIARGDVVDARRQLMVIADRSHEQGSSFNEMTALHDALRLGENIAPRLSSVASQVDGAWSAACGRHADAVVAGTGKHLEAAASGFESGVGFLLVAAEVFGQASAAYRAEGVAAASRRCATKAAELLARCEGSSTPLTMARPLDDPLTDRETQVAVMAAGGLSSPEIAVHLSISVRTVDNLLQRAYRKFGVSSRAELGAALGPGALPAHR